MRRQLSCPDCGFVYNETSWEAATTRDKKHEAVSVTCPRCKVHYSIEDFDRLARDKYSQEAEL